MIWSAKGSALQAEVTSLLPVLCRGIEDAADSVHRDALILARSIANLQLVCARAVADILRY